MTRGLLVGGLLLSLIVATPGAQQPTYDVVIHGGMIVDGTGNPWYRADLGIRDGKIARIGTLDPGQGRRAIDAAGKALSPGFIDLHTHSDLTLLIDGTAQSKVRQGVTLDVLGERGSVGPLEGVVEKDYATGANRRYGYADVSWSTIAGYFDKLEAQGTSINVATSVAPQQIKRAVVGYENRMATPEELERMKRLVADAMREGAVGLSSAYGGGGFDNEEEIFEMAKVAAEAGGYYATHVGSEGYQLVEEVEKAIRVAEVADIPVHLYHLKIRGRNLWGKVQPALDLIEAARARGLEITANQYPYTAMQHPWGALFPDWFRQGPPEQIVERLKDPAVRAKLKQDAVFKQYVEEHGGWEGSVGSIFKNPALKPVEGKTIAEIAKIRGDADPADTCFDLIVEDGGFPNGIWHNMSEDDVKHIMRLPWMAIASDGTALRPDGVLGQGFPHPRSFGTNPRILAKYVREDEVLTLEDAVRKMTSFPAQILRVADRGLLREGYWADIVVFDPATVKDVATFEDPKRYPVGIDHVLVNGVLVVEAGEHTGAKPGKAILGSGRGPAPSN